MNYEGVIYNSFFNEMFHIIEIIVTREIVIIKYSMK